MRDAVVHSHRAWPPDGGVPRDPFAWGPAGPSTFEVTWIREGMRHEYGFVADDDRFLEEWLYAWPSSRKQVWSLEIAYAGGSLASLVVPKMRM